MKNTVIILLLFLLCACVNMKQQNDSLVAKDNLINNDKNMKVESSVFKAEEKIPAKYTCDGANVNPELAIMDIPENAKTLVLIVDDPDAPGGTWLHWTLWNIPVSGPVIINENSVPMGAREGTTDFGNTGWGGPCPPSGEHRYFFKVYALDTELDLPEGASLEELQDAIRGHVIDSGELIGVYSR